MCAAHSIGTHKFNLLSFKHKAMGWVILFIEKYPDRYLICSFQQF